MQKANYVVILRRVYQYSYFQNNSTIIVINFDNCLHCQHHQTHVTLSLVQLLSVETIVVAFLAAFDSVALGQLREVALSVFRTSTCLTQLPTVYRIALYEVQRFRLYFNAPLLRLNS